MPVVSLPSQRTMNTKKIVNFIFELNQLKRERRSGFLMAGVDRPDSIAEHALRAAQIGYILAVMEKYERPEEVGMMMVIHDNAEARIGDHHKVAARYMSKEPERLAYLEQIEGLGKEIEEKWLDYFNQHEKRDTKAGVIAKDADWLEMAFQAKEYLDLGHKSATDWINNVEKAVETKSAKEIIKVMKKTEFTDWWQGLKKMTYTKLKK